MSIPNQELHRIALTAIIYKGNKFLITKRSDNKKAFPGKWTVPGGGLETDDYTNTQPTFDNQWYLAVENALRRELREEVGLEIEKPQFLLDLCLIRPDGIPVVVLSYMAEYKSGNVKLDEDSTEFVWVTYEEAKNYDLIEGILGELEMADKILRGHEQAELVYNPA